MTMISVPGEVDRGPRCGGPAGERHPKCAWPSG